jgi:hypothetical protein
MDFGEVLTRAWKIIWKYKVLWIFGILSSCGQGGGSGGGGGNSGVQFSGRDPDLPLGLQNFFRGLENYFQNIQGWQIAALIVGFILFILFLVLITAAISTVGRIGLVQGTVKAEAGAESLGFGELFNSGKPFFWRIFAFNFLAGIAVFIIILLLLVPLIGLTALTLGFGLLCLIPFICLLVPLGWLVSVVFEQVNIAIVVEDLDIVAGLKRGWDVFRNNIGNMIVMGLILGIGGLIVGFILAIPMFLVLVPLAIGFFGSSGTGSEFLFGGGIAVALLCLVIYLPFLIVLNGILQSYIKTAWTLTYLRLTGLSESSNTFTQDVDDNLEGASQEKENSSEQE